MIDQLSVNNLCFSRGSNTILNNVCFSTGVGKLQYLCGHNGAGKTTLLRILAQLIEPDSGTIQYPSLLNYSSLLAFLGHKDGLKSGLTALENIRFELILSGAQFKIQIIEALLHKWGITYDLQTKPVAELSLGQRKRIALCLVQAKQSRVWLLDEPLSALDKHGQLRALDVMQQHVENGGIVILSQHERAPIESILYDFGGVHA